MASITHHRLAYGLLSPTLVLMILSGVIPFALVIYFSLHDTFAGSTIFGWEALGMSRCWDLLNFMLLSCGVLGFRS